MLLRAANVIAAAFVAATLGASSAGALVIGAGQSATIDFDFSGSQAAIDASTQPLTLSFEMTTSVADRFDDPAGLFSYQYLDIGAVPTISFGYDATGGLTSLGLLSVSVITTDLAGSLRLSFLTESVELVGVAFSVQDFNGASIIGTTGLSLPETVDAQIPAPGALLLFGLGAAGLRLAKRKRAV